MPKQEIWVEKDLDRWELPFIVSHEYLELRLMRDQRIEYNRAHEICSRVEFNFRKGEGVRRFSAWTPQTDEAGLVKADRGRNLPLRHSNLLEEIAGHDLTGQRVTA